MEEISSILMMFGRSWGISMFKYFVLFHCWLAAPNWMRDHTPDQDHFYRRLFTAKHKAKRRKVKSIWITALSVLLLFPSPPIIVATLLFTTFLSFSYLDES